MNNKSLLANIEQAFASGNNQQGLLQLRDYNKSNTHDAGSHNRQAVIEEQIGDWQLAGKAHMRCIDLAPHISSAYLYAGYWLQQSNNIDGAAACYSLAQEAQADCFDLSKLTNHTDQAKVVRIQSAVKLLAQHLSSHHRNSLQQDTQTQTVTNSLWVQTHDQTFSYKEDLFAPQIFYIPELKTQPYLPTESLAWAKNLEAHASVIIHELEQALGQNIAQQQLRPYLDKHSKTPDGLQALAGSGNWSALDLFKDGVKNNALIDVFPETLKLLKQTPFYSLHADKPEPYEAFFSLLKPGQSIAPHYGQSNHSLTVHLALDIPQDCYLEVAQQVRQWEPEKLLIFDDSYLHSAHNNSQKIRIVLIFSIWNPNLNTSEQAAIQACFKARQQWMLERRNKLSLLLS